MSKTGIALAALFLSLAAFQGARALFGSDVTQAPPPAPLPTTSPEASPSETGALKPFPKFTGRPPEAENYGSADELAAALKEQGIECTNLVLLDESDATLDEFALCDPGSTERRLNFYMYPRPANRQFWLGNLKAQKFPMPLVWGPNWIVVAAGDPQTAKARIRSIQGALGGTIEDFAPKK